MEENNVIVTKPTTGLNMFADQQSFNAGYTMAKVLAGSTIVPPTFKGNIGNAMIAIDMAQRMHTNPLMVMQNLYLVYNQPAWSAKFLIACINASGLFATPLRYEFVGKKGTDDWGCYAYATDKQGEVLKGSVITIGIARASGWLTKKDSMWLKEPEQMLRYRAATRFQTAYCPEISCGLGVKEDIEDAHYTEVTSDNVSALSESKEPSAEEQLQAVKEKEEAEANSQQLNMNNGTEAAQSQQQSGNDEHKEQTAQNAVRNGSKPKPQPMGKQETPDIFKKQQ